MLPTAALPLLTLAALVIEGDTDCPSPPQVRESLAALKPSPAPQGWTGRLGWADGRLQIELRAGSDGEDHARIVARRELPGGHRCEELAAAAAVTFATWLDEAPWQTLPARALPSTAAAATAPRLREEHAARPAELAVGARATAALATDEPFAIGASFGGAMALSAFSPWTLHATAELETARVALGQTRSARWLRPAMHVGIGRTLLGRGRAVALQARAGAKLAVLTAAGDDFGNGWVASPPLPGAEVALRLSVAASSTVATFVAMSVRTWLHDQTLVASTDGARSTLPATGAAVSIGVSIGRGSPR